jgi:ribosomal protein L11 methyltransferase
MTWRQFVMDLEQLDPDTVEAIFARHGVCSVTYSDKQDQPLLEPAPGEAPLWRETRITGLFDAAASMHNLCRDLRHSLQLQQLPAHEIEELEDRDWEREWLKDFSPMRFGQRLWVCPGTTSIDDSKAVIIRLDPGLAFGTGTHATTAMCLEWLDGLSLRGKTMLDYGCGSGVLAIAALKLGCSSAHAMDIDPQAARATTSNAAANSVAERLQVSVGEESVAGQFDVVIANILAGPLIELAPALSHHVARGCLLCLSGILSEQVDDVRAAYRPWIEFDAPHTREQGGQNWARLTGQRIEN